jgi:hypothetical protein
VKEVKESMSALAFKYDGTFYYIGVGNSERYFFIMRIEGFQLRQMNKFYSFEGTVENAYDVEGTNFFITTSEIDRIQKFDFTAEQNADPLLFVNLNTGPAKGAGADGIQIIECGVNSVNQHVYCLTNEVGNPSNDGRL